MSCPRITIGMSSTVTRTVQLVSAGTPFMAWRRWSCHDTDPLFAIFDHSGSAAGSADSGMAPDPVMFLLVHHVGDFRFACTSPVAVTRRYGSFR
ncbi:unannotated protein [freshwater metagenome]|uniref:Unannotated protein n=1 Tax=freshwater metagenome TaxID=449393 RepID=A0A6J6M7R8_9ZZZZ